jgi:hypothetical protein
MIPVQKTIAVGSNGGHYRPSSVVFSRRRAYHGS